MFFFPCPRTAIFRLGLWDLEAVVGPTTERASHHYFYDDDDDYYDHYYYYCYYCYYYYYYIYSLTLCLPRLLCLPVGARAALQTCQLRRHRTEKMRERGHAEDQGSVSQEIGTSGSSRRGGCSGRSAEGRRS